MNRLHLQNARGKLTRLDMKSRVEAMLGDINNATADLLQDIDNAKPLEARMMREEATRLNGIAFSLTRCLCHDNIETAYQIVSGDPDHDGQVLGVVA